jgi:hypothetical protein
MPLSTTDRDLIRKNLECIRDGKKAPVITVGSFTSDQLAAINKYRKKQGFPPISGEIFFIGRHVYESRIVEDGYTIEDVLDQITNAFDPESTVVNGQKLTAIRNPTKRTDRYGNHVRDEAVFECWRHNPKSQLYSVIARGDKNKPSKTKEAAEVSAAPFNI